MFKARMFIEDQHDVQGPYKVYNVQLVEQWGDCLKHYEFLAPVEVDEALDVFGDMLDRAEMLNLAQVVAGKAVK